MFFQPSGWYCIRFKYLREVYKIYNVCYMMINEIDEMNDVFYK